MPSSSLTPLKFAKLAQENPGISKEELFTIADEQDRMERQMGLGVMKPGAIPPPQNPAPSKLAMAARIGGGIIGPVVGGMMGGPPGAVAGGAYGGAAGEIAGSYIDGDTLSPPQVVAQAGLGMIPVKGAGLAVGAGERILGQAVKGGLMGAGSSAVTDIANGQMPSMENAMLPMAFGTALGGAAESVPIIKGEVHHQIRNYQNGTPLFTDPLKDLAGFEKYLKPDSGKNYGILTAANPGRTLTAAENEIRNAALIRDLKYQGYKPRPQQGHFGGEPEPSFLIPNMKPDDAAKVGRKAEQVSVISNGEYNRLADDARYQNRAYGAQITPDAADNYSEIAIAGKPVRYKFDIPDEAFGPPMPAHSETPHLPAEDLPLGHPELKSGATGSSAASGPAVPELADGLRGTQGVDTGPSSAALPSDIPPPQSSMSLAEEIANTGSLGQDIRNNSLNKPGTALSVASLSGASAIDDSDPNDPHQQLKHYGKLALNIAGAAGIGAAIRTKIPTAQKTAASQGAALMMLGKGKKEWATHIAGMGIAPTDIPKVRAASEKLFERHVMKAEGNLPSLKKLLKHIATGSAERGWYDDVQKEMEEVFGQDAKLMTSILGVTSSHATVKSNVTLALKAYARMKITGDDFEEGFLPAVVTQLNKVKADQPIAGRKIDNFIKALNGDPEAVVVDQWMMRAWGFKKEVPSEAEYDLIENSIREMAKTHEMTPREIQASIWFSIKNKTEQARGKINPAPPYGGLIKTKLEDIRKVITKQDVKKAKLAINPKLFDMKKIPTMPGKPKPADYDWSGLDHILNPK